MDYYVDGELCTRIEVDFRKEQIHIVNYAVELSKRAFGFVECPEWKQFTDFLEKHYLKASGVKETGMPLLREQGKVFRLTDMEGEYDGQSLIIKQQLNLPRSI